MLQLKLIRLYFRIISFLMPGYAGKKAFEVFQKVRKKSIRPREKAFFDRADHFTVAATLDEGKDEKIDCYRLGDPSRPLVFLVHGWDSNAGSLSQLAEELLKSGCQVVLFNLPGHAFYTRDKTNMLECGEALAAVIRHVRKNDAPFSIISHSFGSAVTAYCMAKHQFTPKKMVFLTTPNRIEDIFMDFKRMVALGDKSYQKMVEITEQKLKQSLSQVTTANNLNNSHYENLLLIHDEKDRVLPYKNSKMIDENVPQSTLKTYQKIGHYKMLWNEEVILDCVRFILPKE